MEAARAATLAVHSAASLSWAASPSAARLLRVAEGLVRAATSALLMEGASKKKEKDKSGGGAAPGSRTGTTRSARRRRRRRLSKEARSRAYEVAGGDEAGSKGANDTMERITELAGGMAMEDGYMEGGEVFDTYAVHLGAAPAASATRPQAGPSVVQAMEDMEVEAGSSVATSGARRAKVRYWCSCRFGEPLSLKHRCKGCQWQYSVGDLAGLVQRPKEAT